jgi:hypothetical protein
VKLSGGKRNLDNVGMTASILCAIHCAFVPIMLTSLPILGLGFLINPWLEWSMIIFAFMIGMYAIGKSYLKQHHKPLPLLLLTGGFTIIITGHFLATNLHEAIVVPFGGLLIAVAHFFNMKYASTCASPNHTGH